MHKYVAILAFGVCAFAQNPATPVFPTGKATDSNFGLANSNITAYTLNGAVADGTSPVSITLNAAMVAPAYIRIDNEEFFCPSATGNTLNTCTRQVNNTTHAAHSNGNAVIPVIPSDGWNQILSEIEAMEANSYNLTPNPAYLTCTAGTGGTTAHSLVKLANDGTTLVSGTTCIVETSATSDSSATGVAMDTSSAGTSVRVAIHGQYTCTADGTTTIGHLLGVGTTTAGRCGDLGQSSTTQVSSTTGILGKAISQTTISAGSQVTVNLFGPGHWGLANIPLYINDTTNTNTYAGCPTNVTSYYNGMMVVLNVANTNTTTALTLNVCSLGATSMIGANNTSIRSNTLVPGVPVLLVYQSPWFIALSLSATGESICTNETSGSTLAYYCSGWYSTPAMVGSIPTGQIVWFSPVHTSTGAATFQANGGSAYSVKRNDGTATQAGDLVGGSWYALVYDGTYLRIASNGTSGGGGGSAPFAANQLTDANPTRVSNTEIDAAMPSGGTNVGIGTGYTNFATTPVKFVGTTNPWCTAGGIVYFYVSTGGALMASANSNVTLSNMTLTNVSAGSNTATAFPTDGSKAFYYFTCGNTATNQWDTNPINDARSFLSTQPLSQGAGISITPGPVTSIAVDPGQVTFFTHGSGPPTVTGFFMEFYSDDTNHHLYQCFTTSCTSVTSGQWQQIDGGGGGGGSGTVSNSSVAPALACYTSTGTTVNSCGAHQAAAVLTCADTSGSPTAQSCSTSPTFSPASGDTIIYTTTTAITGDVTVNVNSSSAVHVRKWQGSSVLAASDLKANVPVLMTYDGTYWEISTIGNAPGGGGGSFDPMDMTKVTRTMQGCPSYFHDFYPYGGSSVSCQGELSANDPAYLQSSTGTSASTFVSLLTMACDNGSGCQTSSFFGPILTAATFRPFEVEGRISISSTSSVLHAVGAFSSYGTINNFVGILLNTASSSNWICGMTNSSGTVQSGSATIAAADTSIHSFKVVATAAGSVSCSIDSTTVTSTNTFPTPSGVLLGTQLENLSGSSINLNVSDIRVQVTNLVR